MAWASSRRALILAVLFAILGTIAATVLIATLYRTPTCFDARQNQDEAGVDCGGSCAQVCAFSVAPPVVSFARPVPGLGGRTDLIAYVENPNMDAAARGIPYEAELYDANGASLARVSGVMDLPPLATVPLFIPGIYSGEMTVARAFVSLDAAASSWERLPQAERVPLRSGSASLSGTERAPRVSATIENVSAVPLRNVTVVATVFSAEGNAIAASRTILAEIPAQGSAEAVFTWASPFRGVPARIDVRPVLPL